MNNTSPFNDAFQSLTPLTLMVFIIVFLAFVIYLTYIVRMWFVQSATFRIQEDIAEIKRHLIANSKDSVKSVDDQSAHLKVEKPKLELKKPRPIFIWLSIAIPVLIIGLIILLSIY